MVGVVSTVIDFTVYVSLTRFFPWFKDHYLIANIFSFIIAVTWSFVANKYWSFRNNDRNFQQQYPKFFSVYLLGFAGNQFVLYVLVAWFSVYDIWAKLFASLVIMSWNFLMNKFWTFKS